MTLHELYATLIARGMPEHPRLRLVPSRHGEYWANGADGYCDAPFHDDDARAIITQHALAWAYKRLTLDFIAQEAHLRHDDDLLAAILELSKGWVGNG